MLFPLLIQLDRQKKDKCQNKTKCGVKKSGVRRQSIPDKAIILSKQLNNKSKQNTIQSSMLKTYDSVGEASTKPPLKNINKTTNELKLQKRKKDDNILKLHKKKNLNKNNNQNIGIISSITSPKSQISEENILQFNSQPIVSRFNQDPINLKSSINSKKQKGVKVGKKSYVFLV